MRPAFCLITALLCTLLAACSRPEQPKTQLDPHDTLYGEQIKALDKAKAVEGTIEQDAQHTRDAIDKADATAR